MNSISFRLEWFDSLTKTWVVSSTNPFESIEAAHMHASVELIHKYEETNIRIIAFKEEIVKTITLGAYGNLYD